MSKKLNVIDLFCGCGGLSLGLIRAGFDISLGIDNDAASIRTFQASHNGAAGIIHDLSNPNVAEIKSYVAGKQVDLIVGGPPCQGLSLSGPRRHKDPRNKLFYAYTDLIKLYKPKAILLENVPGLVSLFKGKVREQIISEFKGLGYQVSYKILNSADYGVPQTRKRVFFVGIRSDISTTFEFPTPTHSPNGENGLPKYVTCAEALEDLPSLETSTGEDVQEYVFAPRTSYQEIIRATSRDVRNHISANHSDHVVNTIKLVPEGGNYKNLPEDFKSTRKFNVAWTRFHSQKPAPTIDTGHRHHFHYKYNRVPTVRESARLQSFPDDFIFLGNKTEQFRQVGNAVPPILAYHMGLAIKKTL